MSILNVNKLSPIGSGSTITVAAGIASYTGKINCAEFDNNPSFTGNVTIAGNLGVAGTITYEDVARVDATGISTFREGFGVGPLTGIALTAYKDGSIRSTGIITASSFVGNLSGDIVGTRTLGTGVTVTAAGVVSATSYYGSGANLTGIDANVKVTRVGENNLNGVDSYTWTSLPSGIFEFSYMWYGASLANNTSILFRIGHGGSTQNSGYIVAQGEIGDGTDSVTRSPRTSEIPVQTDSWEASPGISNGRIDFQQAGGNTWTWKMQNYYYATSSAHYVNMVNTGYITLGGVLERAVLFTGSGNFDAGKVYLTYKQLV